MVALHSPSWVVSSVKVQGISCEPSVNGKAKAAKLRVSGFRVLGFRV